jgi:central kinetochore subunit Mal2/MCM21
MAKTQTIDTELSALRTRLAHLRARRANLTSVLLSTRLTSQAPAVRSARQRLQAAKLAKAQAQRNLQNVYQACAGVTAYRVKDPDPNAVDNGNLLGVRIEVMVEGRFVETYHVLFKRGEKAGERERGVLRVHKHTVPACVNIGGLVERWMPTGKGKEQDLVRFGRALRVELVGWHLRRRAVEKLRKEAGLEDKVKKGESEPGYGKVLNAFVSDEEEKEEEDDEVEERRKRRNGPAKIKEIDADLAVRQIDFTWSNGQTASVEVAKDGEVTKGVVRTANGARLPNLEKKIPGRIEGLVSRLST